MRKVKGTRQQRARALLERVLRGPSFNLETTDEATRHYQMWAESWVVDELIDLVPELRKNKPSKRFLEYNANPHVEE